MVPTSWTSLTSCFRRSLITSGVERAAAGGWSPRTLTNQQRASCWVIQTGRSSWNGRANLSSLCRSSHAGKQGGFGKADPDIGKVAVLSVLSVLCISTRMQIRDTEIQDGVKVLGHLGHLGQKRQRTPSVSSRRARAAAALRSGCRYPAQGRNCRFPTDTHAMFTVKALSVDRIKFLRWPPHRSSPRVLRS